MNASNRTPTSAPPGDRSVLISGADSAYMIYLRGTLRSSEAARQKHAMDCVVLDFGLSEDDVRELQDDFGARVVRPQWDVDVAEHHKQPRNLAFACRCGLPDTVPGYSVYVWLDSDAWLQGADALDAYVTSARAGRLAIVAEDDRAYPWDHTLTRWNLGNQLLAFGAIRGLRVYLAPPVNSGCFAVRGDHRLWACWRNRFEAAVRKSGKIIMDQHSLKASILLDRIETDYLPSADNWMCSRARPAFDRKTGRFTVPRAPHDPIRIMHLAGHSKRTEYEISCVDGGSIRTPLLYQPKFDSVNAAAIASD